MDLEKWDLDKVDLEKVYLKLKDKEDEDCIMKMESGFLPKMELTVLLAEPDDSTRQILSALLRNSGYRVEAVSDGLAAWETLKGKPNSIDLILAEVELSSVSGFSLLTLIMDHDVCKHIPVIMMSSTYSIPVSFKCMLKGAADFLTKPVRKNELKNLWRHVWSRRKSDQSSNEHVAQSLTVALPKVEAPCENVEVKDHITLTRNSKECSEAQSSCTTVHMDTKSAYVKNELTLPHDKCMAASNLSDTDRKRREECIKLNLESFTFELESGEEPLKPQSKGAQVKCEVNGFDGAIVESSSVAIDLIGSFQDRPKLGRSAVTEDITSHILTPHLELSLKRFQPTGSEKQKTDEDVLNHSNTSPFSRYSGAKKLICLNTPFANNSFEPEEGVGIFIENSCDQTVENSVGSLQRHEATLSQVESAILCSQPASCQSNSCLSSAAVNYHDTLNVSIYNRSDDSNATAASGTVSIAPEGADDKDIRLHNGFEGKDCDGIIRREAALAKYRLKRSARCFDKKVRYQSRKRLAEKRPRVKGQFVCQVQVQAPPAQ